MLKAGKLKKIFADTIAAQNLHRGKRGRYLSARGGLTLACRKSVSGCGAGGIGLVLGLDTSGRTIRDWEVN